MKTVLSLIVALIAVGPVAAKATEYKFVATNQAVETKICMAVTTNDVIVLKKVLRRAGEGLPSARASVQCNGKSMADFAEDLGFTQIARFIDPDKKAEVIAAIIQ
jgi:hypothetical protein